MKSIIIVIAAAAVLSACAQPKVASSSARTVVIKTAVMTQAAQDLATSECAKQGLHARLISRATVDEPRAIYDCMP